MFIPNRHLCYNFAHCDDLEQQRHAHSACRHLMQPGRLYEFVVLTQTATLGRGRWKLKLLCIMSKQCRNLG